MSYAILKSVNSIKNVYSITYRASVRSRCRLQAGQAADAEGNFRLASGASIVLVNSHI